jgi:hypothetical protein
MTTAVATTTAEEVATMPVLTSKRVAAHVGTTADTHTRRAAAEEEGGLAGAGVATSLVATTGTKKSS